MSALRRLLLRLINALTPGLAEPDLTRQIESHLGLLEEDYCRRGMTRDEARLAARRAFDGVELTKDRHRDARSFVWLDDARRDLAYALRTLGRAPGFTTVVVLTLALGIGANTAIFSVVHAVLVKPMTYSRHGDRLVRLMMDMPASASPTGRPLRTLVRLSAAQVSDLRGRTRTLSRVAGAGDELLNLSGHEDAARLKGVRMSSAVFPMLGARPLLGRVFDANDETPGADPVVLLGYDAWQRYFGGDQAVLHRVLTFESVLGPKREFHYAVIGVMPSDFTFPTSQAQFWVPFQPSSSVAGRPITEPLLGFLGDGVSLATAAAELGPIVRAIRGDRPETTYELVRERDALVAPVRSALVVLMAAVTFLLLIACVNVANLMLARMAARHREIALRVALGAGRGRLIRQTLTESLLLAAVGGVAGIGLAFLGVALLRWLLATTLARVDLVNGVAFPRVDEIGIDQSVLLYAAALTVAVGTAFGLGPALHDAGAEVMHTLRAAADASTRRGVVLVGTVRDLLVVAQITLAMVLLVGGALLLRSFVNLATVTLGYDPSHVLTFQVSLPVDRYPDARLKSFADDLVARLRSAPDVQVTAYANQVPTIGLRDTAGGLWTTPSAVRAPAPAAADARLVSQDYLRTMGIRVIRGRGFDEQDRAGQPRVLLVNQALLRHDFGGEDPIGRQAYVGHDTAPRQIVGVVDDVREFGLDRDPEPQFFIDLRQWSQAGLLFPTGAYYVVRTGGDPTALVPTVRSLVQALDPQAALFNVAPMEELVATTIAPPRIYAVLVGVFAGVGLALAVVGIYGVMTYSVTQRTREIGIRMALGAERGNVLTLVLLRTVTLTGTGMGLGLMGAMALSRYLEGMLFGVTPLDPSTLAAVALLFVAVAVVASYLPARKALVDPAIALRAE